MSINKIFKNITREFKKCSTWNKVMIGLAIVLIASIIINTNTSVKEGFIQKEKFILKKDGEIFDNFYVDLYDELLFSNVKNEFEIGEIINKTSPTSKSLILDIGSGTGHHVNAFTEQGISAIGIDESVAMVEVAKEKYPNSDYRVVNSLNTMAFPAESFTHITCLYFTLYYIKDKKQFFENCFHWLVPGGKLVVHLVDRENFDPIVPAGDPMKLMSPQKYAKERITNTIVKFNNFQYTANFEEENFPNDLAVFKEVFKDDKTGNMRANEHKLYMPTQKHILSMAKDVGFILLSEVDMKQCNYDSQYLYVLEKPN